MIAAGRGSVFLVAAVLAAALVVLLPAGAARAHDDILGATAPAADAALDSLPAEVRLTFIAPLAPIDPLVVVRASDGTSVADGAPVMADGAVVQALLPDTGAGQYTVSWRVVAEDGHPSSGAFAFTVLEPAATTPATSEPAAAKPASAEPSAAGASSAASSSSSDIPSPVLLAGMAAALVALFLLPALVWRRRSAAGPTSGEAAATHPDPGESR